MFQIRLIEKVNGAHSVTEIPSRYVTFIWNTRFDEYLKKCKNKYLLSLYSDICIVFCSNRFVTELGARSKKDVEYYNEILSSYQPDQVVEL